MQDGLINLKRVELVVIGGSAGSLDVILHTLQYLQKDIPFAIVIVLHRKSSVQSTLAELLKTRSGLQVKEPEDKEVIQRGCVYIAPADYHLLIENNQTFSLDYSEKVNFSRPSIDVTFETAAEVYSNKLFALMLSGANADGVQGLMAVKKNKGLTAAQNPQEAEVPFMPQQAIDKVGVDYILSTIEIPIFINQIIQAKY